MILSNIFLKSMIIFIIFNYVNIGCATEQINPPSYLDKGYNNSYAPQWEKKDSELIMDTIGKGIPTYELYVKIFKGRNYDTDNPNYFKHFFKSDADKVKALSEIASRFDTIIASCQNDLDKFDEQWVEKKNSRMQTINELIQSTKDRILSYQKVLENAKAPSAEQQL